MRLLRLWRQYDSIKATVLLVILAVLLIGYCVRAATEYAVFLQSPTEYLCAAPVDTDKILPQLAVTDGVRACSRQRTAYLSQEWQGCNVTLLSAAYLSDCYGLSGDSHTVWMNEEAFTAFCGTRVQSPVDIRGTLDGQPITVQIICTDALPQGEPLAILCVSAAMLHDADTLRICTADRESFSPESLGLTVLNPEQKQAAEYAQTLLLLRIRFGALSAALAMLAAAAFLRVYRDAAQSNPS